MGPCCRAWEIPRPRMRRILPAQLGQRLEVCMLNPCPPRSSILVLLKKVLGSGGRPGGAVEAHQPPAASTDHDSEIR